MGRKTLLALLLLARFLRAVVISGFQTLRVILRSGRHQPPPMAFVRVGFAPMSETGAALLGCMVSLTPGTTTIDVDMARRELLLHMLDASDTKPLLDVIRRDFEPALVALFSSEQRA